MKIIKKDIKEEILCLYKLDKTVVEDDKRLMANIWHRYGWDQSQDLLTNLKKMPSSETIRRTRQKLHQDGLIEYSEGVEERRYEASKEVTEELGTSPMPKIMGSGRKATAIIEE
jgi:hypothetical protein